MALNSQLYKAAQKLAMAIVDGSVQGIFLFTGLPTCYVVADWYYYYLL